jgi:hypothetical protein
MRRFDLAELCRKLERGYREIADDEANSPAHREKCRREADRNAAEAERLTIENAS